MHNATGLSRMTINKYLSELPTMLPAPAVPEDSNVQKSEGDVQTYKLYKLYVSRVFN